MTPRLARVARAAGLVAAKLGASAWAVHAGFTHVSDDDYARVVIAEGFAHAPSLDPSGTSWLPFPFWLTGAAMWPLGRSLVAATAVAWLSGLASPLVAYLAMRAAKVPRAAAWAATALVATTPWNAWLGVATVPEALTASLGFAGAMTLAASPDDAGGRRARLLAGVALLLAALSRYEAWPLCAVFAARGVVDGLRRPAPRAALFAAAGLAAAGPLLWLAWNARAHGDALHFLARVTTFHAAHAASPPGIARLLAFPRALATGAPEIAAIGALGLFGDAGVRRRWRGPLLAVLALLAFLGYGEVVGGAPTHHPERALLVVWWVLGGLGLDAARSLLLRHAWARPKREAWAVALGVVLVGAILGARLDRMASPPGGSVEEDRAPQLARGAALRADRAETLVVVPCAYEHFALIAAFGAPERVDVARATGATPTAACPEVFAR